MTLNRLSAAVALAFVSTVPFSALAEAPSVNWRTPTAGATLSGTISGSACAADATSSVGMSRVTFWIGNMQINNDYSSPWNCTLDTRKLRDGTYSMRVDAVSSRGELRSVTRSVTIRNAATSGGTTTTNTAPTVAITAPTPGQSVAGGSLSYAANAIDNAGVSRVEFRLDGALIATDTSAPYSGSRSSIPAGTHTLTATAFDAAGLSSSSSVSFTVPQPTTTAPAPTEPSTTTLPAPTSGSLDVWFKAPLAGATVSGTLSLDKCYVKGTGVSRVNFLVDGKAIGADTNVADGMSCTLDTRTLANGTHQLTAQAVSSTGATRSDVISINVQNTATTTPTTPPPTTTPTEPAPAPTTPPVTSNLPNGGSAVPTFHSLGLYWKPTSTPGAAGCLAQDRKAGDAAFKPARNLWYDRRNAECRGSIVSLQPGTQYEVQFGVGSTYTQKLLASTWAEQFPIAQTITLPAGTVSQPVNITTGGSASGYVLYQAHPNGTTIDVGNAYDQNVLISAPYVIVRGVTMKNARINGVSLRPGAHHVVIEGNDISGWGRTRGTVGGKAVGVDMDSGIRAACSNGSSINTAMNTFVIQRNKIRNPRYTANSWTNGHPAGPQAVTLSYCGGNHVIRYNDMANTNGNKFNDAIGGEDNFTQSGAPVSDSDIYGNLIVGAWDDGIESEGSNRNVRIWGNYIDDTAIGIASTVTHHGPLYVFRNVYNRSRKLEGAADSDDRGPFFKSGSGGSNAGHGRRYVFHNTALQPSVSGAANGGGAGIGIAGNTNEPLTNTVTRNNIFHIWKGTWPSISQNGTGFSNDADFDLYNGSISANSGAESNGIKAVPAYLSGSYQLAPSSPGFGKGAKLNNFNDDVAAPDMGAAQTGKPAMKFGVQ